MKKILLIMLVAAIVVPTFQSCKKGENDPGISFRSRKARLTGEWTLKEGSITQTFPGGSEIINFNGSTVTIAETGYDPITFVYTQKITIEKDDSYKDEINNDGDLVTEEGGWFFGDKNKELDLKNKEIVCFSSKKVTSGSQFVEYSGLDAVSSPNVWMIDRLANKEIIILMDGSEKDSDGDIYTTTGTLTYTRD